MQQRDPKRIGDLMRPKPSAPQRPPDVAGDKLAAELAALIRATPAVPWQVPVLVQLAANARTPGDRAGFLRRALGKLQAAR